MSSDQRIARILALGIGGDDDSVRCKARQVLGRMNGEVDTAVEELYLERRREDPAPADRGQR